MTTVVPTEVGFAARGPKLLAAHGGIEESRFRHTRLLFLLLVFAGWAAAFVAGSLARARLPHPRARTTPWWPLAPVAPRSQAHDFRLHRGSYPLTALAALLTGGVVLMLAVLDGGGSGGASLVVLCLSIGWLQVTTARERYPHLHPHLTWISGSRGCPV